MVLLNLEHSRITSTMWLASVSISCASYASSDAPWRQMLHTRWFGLWSTLESTTITDFSLLVRGTCSRSYSLSFAPPPDVFCSSHIVRPFLTLCDGSCTGSRCQIASGSNCVRWYTDACTDSLLTICPISAHPPYHGALSAEIVCDTCSWHLFVVRANVIVYKLARANVCIELNWIEPDVEPHQGNS